MVAELLYRFQGKGNPMVYQESPDTLNVSRVFWVSSGWGAPHQQAARRPPA